MFPKSTGRNPVYTKTMTKQDPISKLRQQLILLTCFIILLTGVAVGLNGFLYSMTLDESSLAQIIVGGVIFVLLIGTLRPLNRVNQVSPQTIVTFPGLVDALSTTANGVFLVVDGVQGQGGGWLLMFLHGAGLISGASLGSLLYKLQRLLKKEEDMQPLPATAGNEQATETQP
ncbi:hypothetical protein V8F06_008084 [Rhypophila decipiens]